MTKFSAFFISLLFAVSVNAEQVCFATMEEHEAIKDKLPNLFKELPVILGVDSPGMVLDVFVILKIVPREKAIVFDSDVYVSTSGRTKDKVEVKNVCYDTDSKAFRIQFKNNGKAFDAVYDNNGVATRGVVLKKLSLSEQKTIKGKIEAKPTNNPAAQPAGQ
ncbi:hypothetical protein K2P97_10675 [bacterium]|nr:hypothetical protein [bacterium]